MAVAETVVNFLESVYVDVGDTECVVITLRALDLHLQQMLDEKAAVQGG